MAPFFWWQKQRRFLKNNEIKKLVGIALERGLIKAFYSPDGMTIIPGEGLQTRLLDLINEKGKIYIDTTYELQLRKHGWRNC